MGLAGLLRERGRDVVGLLNGIDTSVWNPSTDPHIATHYDSGDLGRRSQNKVALQKRLGLDPAPDAFLLGVISRLSWQKGLDLLLDVLSTTGLGGMQLALLGSGEPDLQSRFQAAAQTYPGQVGVEIAYDEPLAHLIQAGADTLVVPSRFEPCGLTQLCALRYGAVPIVSRVGGLEDTIVDFDQEGSPTGFKFSPTNANALSGALFRAHAVFRDKAAWRKLQQNGMSTDVSWRDRANRYAALYHAIVVGRR
jgi:starch synthase